MANKMTVKDHFMELRTLAVEANRPDLVEFVDGRIAQVVAKNEGQKEKHAKAQQANVDLMSAIYEAMETEKRYRVSEINKFDFLRDFTLNKVNYLVRGLKLDGRVRKIEEKGVAYFVKA